MIELGALRTGQVDVLVQDDPVVRYWLTDPDDADFAIVAGRRTRERYGFAVGKARNPALLRLIDQVIAESRRRRLPADLREVDGTDARTRPAEPTHTPPVPDRPEEATPLVRTPSG